MMDMMLRRLLLMDDFDDSLRIDDTVGVNTFPYEISGTGVVACK